MVSPGTHLLKNHESQSRTNVSQLKKKRVRHRKFLGLYVTRPLIWKTDSETLYYSSILKLKYSSSVFMYSVLELLQSQKMIMLIKALFWNVLLTIIENTSRNEFTWRFSRSLFYRHIPCYNQVSVTTNIKKARNMQFLIFWACAINRNLHLRHRVRQNLCLAHPVPKVWLSETSKNLVLTCKPHFTWMFRGTSTFFDRKNAETVENWLQITVGLKFIIL